MHALLQWCCLAYLKSSNWKIPSVIWRVNISIHRFIFYLNNNNRISIITSSTFDHFIWFFNTDSKILVSSHRKSSDSDGWAREMSKLSIPKEESILPAGLRVVSEILKVFQPSCATSSMATQSQSFWSSSIFFLNYISVTSCLTAPTHELQIFIFSFFQSYVAKIPAPNAPHPLFPSPLLAPNPLHFYSVL